MDVTGAGTAGGGAPAVLAATGRVAGEEVRRAARALDRGAVEVGELRCRLSALAALPWHSPAATAFRGRLDTHLRDGEVLAADCAAAAAALHAHAAAVEAAAVALGAQAARAGEAAGAVAQAVGDGPW